MVQDLEVVLRTLLVDFGPEALQVADKELPVEELLLEEKFQNCFEGGNCYVRL